MTIEYGGPRMLKKIQGHLPRNSIILSTSKGEDRWWLAGKSTVGTVVVVYKCNGVTYRTSLSIQPSRKYE